jgi:hypothetical protein
MSLISNTDLQAVVDKLAKWAATAVGDEGLDDAFTAGFTVANADIMSGANSLFTYFAPGGTCTDGDVVADLLPAFRDLDESNPSPPSRFMIQIANISAVFTALNTHIRRYNPATTTLDAYLSSLNDSSPTLRVHQALHDYLKAFSRKNVFIANDTVLATLAVTGASTGTFTSVATIGSSYAGAKLVVKNQGANTTGANLSIIGKKLDGTTQVLTVTVSSGSDDAEQDLSSTAKLFTEVTNITVTSGTNTDVYEIVAKTDRDISAV